MAIDQKLIEIVNEQLQIILDEAVFDERAEKIFRLRYGIECIMQSPKVISKEVKVPMKKLNLELIRIENKVFNILKKHNVFE